jgi:hypothetical protein
MKNDRSRLLTTSLVVAAGIIIVIFIYADLVPSRYTGRIDGKWIRFSIESGFFFWYLLASYRKLRRSIQFWTLYLIVFSFHVAAVGHLYAAYSGGISTITFVSICMAEFVFMGLIIRWFLKVWPSRADLTIGHRDRSRSSPD